MSDFYIPGQFSKKVSKETNNLSSQNNSKPNVSDKIDSVNVTLTQNNSGNKQPRIPSAQNFYVPGQIQAKEKEYPVLGGLNVQQKVQTISWAEKIKEKKEEKKKEEEILKGLVPKVKEKDYSDLKPLNINHNIDFYVFLRNNMDDLVNIFEEIMNYSDFLLDRLNDENGFKKFAHFIYKTYYLR